MSYTETIVQAVIDTLSRTAGLPTFQFAGHGPNLAFWMEEVRHAKAVLAGYPTRFANMAAAQSDYDADHPESMRQRERHEYDYHPLRPALNPAQAARLLRQLDVAAERLVDRCLREELIDLPQADDLRISG